MRTFVVRVGKWAKAKLWVPITKNKMAFSAFLLSVFALGLAFLTFYYQFCHTSHDFKGLVVDYMPNSSGGRSARVVLINNGNRYETLCDANLIYSRSKDFSGLVFASGSSVDGPVVLGPGERRVCLVKDRIKPEIVLLRSEGGIKPVKGDINTVLAKLDEQGKLPFRLYYGVLFEVAGNSGIVHKAWCLVSSIEVTKEYPLVFHSGSVNRMCDLLTETFAPGGTVRAAYREN